MKLTTAGCLAALAAHTLATPTSSPNSKNNKFSWTSIKSLIAFGDSYTYVQGTLGHTNYTFIGDAFNLSFTAEKLFSNRILQNQTSTAEGGPNWVEYLTGCGVTPGLHNPQTCNVQLWDFAYAGANTVSQANFTPAHWNHTVSFQQQIQQLVDYGNPALESINLKKKDALVAVWIGINDINDLAKPRKNATVAPLYETVQNYVFESVEKVYALGYKKFLFMNLPPLDRGPSPSVNASMVASFNAIHAAHANAFQTKHKDATVLQYDVNSVLNNVLDTYQDHGFVNITNFCPGYNQPDILTNPEKYGCGAGLDTYFWYNSGHLTSRTHKIFTEKLVKWLGKQK
ncbi:carbohydrate esterase family 16 protein [Plenodomus tracheiphilus IPT5]|uniref:Carbohydrate esterase family 16 protein n=1 Tax=Plenodomus tracheiphilus IPT5 TaxID=1408161 RepID=A0A6A7BB91_9PLEO|nr:carbohydrate esterase family 16 protein [Plenodomus tracheiphilus IPT5]